MKRLILAALLSLPLAAGAQTKEQAIGCWVMSARDGESLQLNRDGSFSFNDYNSQTKAFENLRGSWKQNINRVTLMYDDRPQQVFKLVKEKTGWTLNKTGGFHFTRSTPAECSAQ